MEGCPHILLLLYAHLSGFLAHKEHRSWNSQALEHYHYTALQMDTVVHNSSVVINDCHISLITTVQGWSVHTSSRSAAPPVSASLIHLTHHETVFRSIVALLYSVSTHLRIKVHFSTS